jgi:hypothetical protein
MISPTFENLSLEHPNVDFYRVDTDAQPEITKEVGVRAVRPHPSGCKGLFADHTGSLDKQMPTFAAYQNGEKIQVAIGADQTRLHVSRLGCVPSFLN